MRGPWPLVGRDEELDLIEQLLGRGDVGGVILAGDAGTGKTRLAAEAASLLQSGARPIERIVASRATATVPFGAFAPLLPPEKSGSTAASQFADAMRVLAARGGDRQLVLVVDDAHLLDDASAALLHRAVVDGAVSVLATARTGDPLPDVVVSLWKDAGVERLELQPLSRDESVALVEAVLGGPLTTGSARRLWEATEGNPLYLRELVLATIDAGRLVEERGVWRIRGRVQAPPSLTDLLALRLAGLSAHARQALDTLAVAGVLGLDQLRDFHGGTAPGELEREGVVEVTVDDRRRPVRPAHPLYGEIVRARLARTAEIGIGRRLADDLEERGRRRAGDVLRLVTWRLTAGDDIDPDLLTRAAREAYHAGDYDLAERLARARLVRSADHAASVLLAQLLDETGRHEDAEAVLGALEGAATHDQGPVVALLRSDNLFFGLGREEDAFDVLAAAETVHGKPAVGEITANRGWLQLHAGRPADALATVAPLLDRRDTAVRVAAGIVMSGSLGVLGRTQEALMAADVAAALQDPYPYPAVSRHRDFPALVRGFALLHAGRLAAAEELAGEGLGGSLDARPSFMAARWVYLLGRVCLAQGRLGLAARHFRNGASLQSRLRQPGLLGWNLAGEALAAAQSGEIDAAESAVAELDRIGPTPSRLLDSEIARARAWVAAARGERSAALALLDEAADTAAGRGLVMPEVAALHDLVRLGAQPGPEGRLAELAGQTDTHVVALAADHARARADRSTDDLEGVAAAFERLGAVLLAAETVADVAAMDRAVGRSRRAQRHQREAVRLAERCGGPTTPALRRGREVVPLTPREREIVTLAAGGMTSRAIAERLVISVRTVHNLLQRAYRKLGVHSRAEAATALGVESGSPSR